MSFCIVLPMLFAALVALTGVAPISGDPVRALTPATPSDTLLRSTYLPFILSRGAPILYVSLNPPEGPVGALVQVAIGGQWTPGVQVFVTLVPHGVSIPPPSSQAVSTGATAIIPSDGSPVFTQFIVPNDPRVLGPQPIQVVVHTGTWSEWAAEPFFIVDAHPG